MPLSALALVLVAALLHATWNLIAKKSPNSKHLPLMSALMVLVLWSPLGLLLAWQQAGSWGWREWALVLASAIGHLVYFQTLLAGYRASDLTVVYPVARGTGPMVSSFVAVLVLGETLGPQGIAGVLGIAGGVFLIAGGPKLWSAAHDPAQRQRMRAGVAWGAVTGLLIATYTVIDGYAVKVLLMSPILVDWVGNALRIPFLLPTALADRSGFMNDFKQQWRGALALGAISPVGYVLVLYAAQMAPLSHVAPAREVSMLFAALIGGRLLGEADRGLRLLGAAFIAAGVMALAWG